jgi:oligopeptidase B
MVVAKGWKQDGTPRARARRVSGSTTEATFNSSVLSLVDRGWLRDRTHPRREGDGPPMVHDGKMMKKKNTFNDFVDVGQYLVDNKYNVERQANREWRSAGGC